MKKHDITTSKFKQENLIKTVASYQLYYQLSISKLIEESSFDKSKIDELGLDIDPENVFNTMIEIIDTFNKEDNFDFIFKDNIRVNALIHALKDFTLRNEELDNEEKIYDTFYEKIMNDEFFNLSMSIHFEEELKDRIEYWKKLISKKTARELKESAIKQI